MYTSGAEIYLRPYYFTNSVSKHTIFWIACLFWQLKIMQSVMENIKAGEKNLFLNFIIILWTINLTKNLTEHWTKEYVLVIKFTKQMKFDFKKYQYYLYQITVQTLNSIELPIWISKHIIFMTIYCIFVSADLRKYT